jgi:hypothetical protein
MWKNFFGNSASKRPAAPADTLTPPRSGAKKPNQNKTPTREDPAARGAAASPVVAAAPPVAAAHGLDMFCLPVGYGVDMFCLPVSATPPVAAAPPVEAVEAAPPMVLRSMAEAHKDRDMLMNNADMCCLPVGPYDTEERMIQAVQAWAGKPETNGGAFAIPPKLESLKEAGKTKGPRRLLLCDRSGKLKQTKSDNSRPKQLSKKCDCHWGVWIEQCQQGWTTVEMPKKARDILGQPGATVATIHNHILLQTVPELNTNANLRGIPAHLEEHAESLSRASLTPHKIFAALVRECKRLGLEVTFTRRDIQNKYGDSSGDKALDCSNLIQYLQDRQSEDDSLPFNFRLSQDGMLDCVFLS